jgi:hypothetical protein
MAPNGTDDNKLTLPQQKAIAALMSTRGVVEAAKVAQVGQRSLSRWLAEDVAFKAALAVAEGELIGAATRRLLQHQDVALSVILSIMADKEYPAGVRLRAAMAIVDTMLKLRELRNIEERLTALEAAYAQQTR